MKQEMEFVKLSFQQLLDANAGRQIRSCGCGCYYANQPAGATTADNMNANFSSGENGLHSPPVP